jgi:hypothetical protein
VLRERGAWSSLQCPRLRVSADWQRWWAVNFPNFPNFPGIRIGRKFAVSPSFVLTD